MRRYSASKVELQQASCLCTRIHLGLEEAVSPASVDFGAIECQVSAPHQRSGIHAVCERESHADARPDIHEVSLDHVGTTQEIDEALGQGPSFDSVRHAALDHRELVPAEPSRCIDGPDRGPEALGHDTQERITDWMAEVCH